MRIARAACCDRIDRSKLTMTEVESPPAAPLDLVVSIINFRTAQMTIDCVQSVLDDIGDLRAHVVIVENGSGDGSDVVLADWLTAARAENPDIAVSLVVSAENTGFSGGHNQGIRAMKARFYFVLNSDAVVHKGCLAALLADAEAHPETGLFAARLEYDDGTRQISCFRFPTPGSEMIRGAQSGPVTRLLKRYDIPLDMPPAQEQIEWASFAAIMLRGEMIDAIGLMDEGYFLYFEDTEYCLRARRAGWGTRYVEGARAIHFRGGSAPVKSLAKARKRLPAYYYASRTRLMYQSHGRIGLLAANLAWYLGTGLTYARLLLTRKVNTLPVESEMRDIWTNFMRPLGDRRAPK